MLISDYYRDQNRKLHESGKKYGERGHNHLKEVKELMQTYDCETILDYGCGKAKLSEVIECVNYDPAIPEYDNDPNQCDLIISTDVLEHIEPEYIGNVLQHMKSKMKKAGYFVINTAPDNTKTLPDGSDPHQLVRDSEWWINTLSNYFHIEKSWKRLKHLYVIVT